LVFRLNIKVLCSVELAAKSSLSIDIAISVMGLLKPLREVPSSFPVLAFHILINASPPPVAIASPSGLKQTQVTSLLCAGILNCVLVGTFIS